MCGLGFGLGRLLRAPVSSLPFFLLNDGQGGWVGSVCVCAGVRACAGDRVGRVGGRRRLHDALFASRRALFRGWRVWHGLGEAARHTRRPPHNIAFPQLTTALLGWRWGRALRGHLRHPRDVCGRSPGGGSRAAHTRVSSSGGEERRAGVWPGRGWVLALMTSSPVTGLVIHCIIPRWVTGW